MGIEDRLGLAFGVYVAVTVLLMAFFPWRMKCLQDKNGEPCPPPLALGWPFILALGVLIGLPVLAIIGLWEFNKWLYTPRKPKPLPIGTLLSVNDAGHAVPYKPKRKFPWLMLLGWLWRAALTSAVTLLLLASFQGGKFPWQ